MTVALPFVPPPTPLPKYELVAHQVFQGNGVFTSERLSDEAGLEVVVVVEEREWVALDRLAEKHVVVRIVLGSGSATGSSRSDGIHDGVRRTEIFGVFESGEIHRSTAAVMNSVSGADDDIRLIKNLEIREG